MPCDKVRFRPKTDLVDPATGRGLIEGSGVLKNQLFFLRIKVGRGLNQEMPPPLIGAIVPAYAVAIDHQNAAKLVTANLLSQGYELVEFEGNIVQLDPALWAEYVSHTWPEFTTHFPDKLGLGSLMERGGYFYGPFAGFERV